jgi:hypothetical protein
MKNMLSYYSIFVAAGLTFLLFNSSQQVPQSTEKASSNPTAIPAEADGSVPQVIKSIDINKTYSFAGETVPTDNFDAFERLDRELSVNTYWHSSTLLNIKNSNRYFHLIEQILAEEGIPDDFKYLAVAESNLRNATSPAGAKGIWQFLKSTGQAYGLEINGQVDERYHVEKATRAACNYLKDYHKRFGSWTLAAAAYNAGGTRISRLLNDQKAQSYYALNINEETSRYVFRIIAIKEILSDPASFGFYVELDQLYKPLDNYTLVTVDKSVANWGDFAIEHGTTYRLLKVYNPWLTSGSLTNSKGKKYEIKVPVPG